MVNSVSVTCHQISLKIDNRPLGKSFPEKPVGVVARVQRNPTIPPACLSSNHPQGLANHHKLGRRATDPELPQPERHSIVSVDYADEPT